jgi:tetratricopeptide (TPR) repeat protein
MADSPNKTGGAPDGSPHPAAPSRLEQFAKEPVPDVPPSKALQWFLLAALVITGAAYVVGQWTDRTAGQTKTRRDSQLSREVQSQSDSLAHGKAGDDAMAHKRYDQAVAEYRLALQAQDTAAGHQSLGEALLKQANSEAAFAQFQEALRLDPKLVKVSSVWGLALMQQGNPDAAAKVLQAGLQRNPDSGLLHYNLATALLQMRVNAEGRRMAAPSGQSAQAQAAETEAKSLAADALAHFSKASRNGVDSPEFWCAYGQLLNQLGEYAEAEPCLVRATSEDAGMAAAHSQLALAQDHLGRYADAIAHYEKVLALTPDDPPTLNDLASLYATATNAEVRSPKMAAQLATRACDATANQNALYMDTLARSYAADGDFFQAITWEDKAIHRATQLNEEDLTRAFQKREALFMEHKPD